MKAVRDQHRRYWSKDGAGYQRYVGADLLRVAETGVRTRSELISIMLDSQRLPAPPSDQQDVRVRVYGNTAVATWLDEGKAIDGTISQNRFTVVLVRREGRWQMVHIQSTGVK